MVHSGVEQEGGCLESFIGSSDLERSM